MRHLLRVLAFAAIAITSSLGQGVQPTNITPDNDTGVRPNQTYAGAHEDIGLANGNLSLEIPLAGFPGRNGLNFKLALQYDSKIWSPHTSFSNTGTDLTFDWRYEQRSYAVGEMGWRLNMPSFSAGDWITDDVGNFVGQTPYIIELPTGGKTSAAYPASSTDSEDGSFVSFSGDNNGGIVTEKDGTRMSITNGLVTKLQDTNGNYLSFSGDPANFTISDTLGRQINFNTGTTTTISYKDTSGAIRTITLSYTALTLFSTDPASPYFTGTSRFDYPVQSYSSNQGTPRYVWVHKPANNSSYNLLTRITFPDGTFYSFSYNGWGELTQITYPTGGYTKYTYGAYQHGAVNWDLGGGVFASDFREVISKRVCRNSNGVCATEDVTTYMPTINSPNVNNSQVDIVNPVGEKTSVAFMNDTPDDPSLTLHSPKETLRQIYNASGTLVKSVATSYVPLEANMGPALPSRTVTTLYDSNPPLVTETDISYDTYSANVRWPPWAPFQQQTFQSRTRYIDNALSQTVYDFGTNVSGPLLRTTNTTWWKGLWSSHIWNRPASEEVIGAGGNRAYTTYEYDNYTEAITATGATQHDPGYGTSYTTRGNQTAVSHYRNTDSTYLTTRHQYDDAGNVRKTTDPGGHSTSISYSSAFQNAYPTQVTLPQTGSVAHVTSSNYNFDTGLKISDTDQNGNVTQYQYDLMLRPTETDFPDGGQKILVYLDANTAMSKTLVSGSSNLYSYAYSDGLGRTIQAQLCEDGTSSCTQAIKTDTTYDAVGRVYTVSNPYRTTSDPTYGITTSQYDALGRVVQTILPDSGYTQDVYSGNWRTQYDVAGKKHWHVSDALGRLTQVEEPDAATGGWGPGTTYSYDALGNLLSVVQDGGSTDSSTWRTRSFTYNSLSQLLTAANPETGTVSYTYDNDGNMTGKTDARGVFVNYNPSDSPIDALHRVTKKTFSDGSPGQVFTYDASSMWGVTAANPVGRLVATNVGGCNGCAVYSYDIMGRIVSMKQAVNNGAWYSSAAAYDKAGGVTSLTYPSGRKVTQGFDTAGRLNNVTFDSFNGTSVGYAYYVVPATVSGGSSGFLPTGAAGTVNLSNGAVETYVQNNRGQPCHYQVQKGSTYLIDRTTFYSASTTACATTDTMMNNGNTNRVVDNLINGRTQTFAYDYLNRITSAHTDATTGTDAWSQTFTYDAFGNMNQAGSLAFSQTFGTNNRINSGGYTFNLSGDLLGDCSHSYAYDAESQVTSIDSGATTYTYDANGNRVRKTTGSNFTEYVYFGGEPIAEKDQTGTWTDYIFAGGKRIAMATGTTSSGTTYFHGDNLGSQRLMTDASGAVVAGTDRTYLPFGWEWNPTTAGSHYKFTGKERDTETGNDYFGARYYNSSMGRWLSPDWSATPVAIPYADMSDPQSLNLYGYVRNRPTFSVDGDGHCFWDACIGEVIVAAAVTTAVAGWLTTDSGKKSATAAVNLVIQTNNQIVDTLANKLSNLTHKNEQGRDAQGKFLPKEPGQTKPGAADEQKGLDAVGADKNTKPSASGRIHDGNIPATGGRAEVKSGNVVGNTEQVRDMSADARAETGQPLTVVVTNPNATVTKPLQKNPDVKIVTVPE